MENKKKNLAWTIICIFVCVIFVPIIIFNITLSIKSAINPEKLPSIFGITPTTVLTGSMSPEIESKDLIFVKSVDTDTLKAKEDVICFRKDGSFITHRIERIEEVDGVKRFYTKGDANNTEDKGYIVAEQIQGKYVAKVGSIGGVIMFLQDPYGLILVIILLGILYIAGELLIEYIAKKKENKQVTKENQELIEENKNLKAQLESYAQATTTQITPPQPPPVQAAGEGIVGSGETIINANGLNIKYRYNRSFTARLIQSGENLQGLYTAIKNYLLKYVGVKNRNSWDFETFSYKRKPILKLCFKGKSLFAYLSLTDQEISSLQIDEKVETSKYADVPAKIKVTGIIKLNRVLKAVDVIIARLGLVVGEEITQTYSYPYETDEQLLKKGLVKLVKNEFELPNQPQEEINQAVAQTSIEGISDNQNGANIRFKYRRSFISRLIQSGEKTQNLYTAVKNRLLGYKGVKSRNSWGSENFSYKRNPIAKLCVKGKTLYLYLALTDQEIETLLIDEKVQTTKYAFVPAKIRITGVVKLNRALKAIEVIMSRLGLTAGEENTQTYLYPYETDEQLLEKGLIKLAERNFSPSNN